MKKALVKLVTLMMCVSFAFIGASPVFAVDFFADEELYIADMLEDDVYAGGGLVSVEEDINGDLYIAGGSLTINGNITGDLVIAGGQVTINGDVSDDVRVAAGSIVLNGNVGDDLIATGGQLNIGAETLIGGTLILGNGYANIMGSVNEDIRGGGGKIVIGGTVYGDVTLEVQDTVVLTENANINGNLIYTSLREAELNDEQVAGFIEFNKQAITPAEEVDVKKQAEDFFSRWHIFIQAVKYLSLLALALVLVLLVPAGLTRVTKTCIDRPWKSLGIGFVVLICSIAAMIILSITVLGIPLALILLALLMITLYVAKVYASLFIGNLIIRPKKMTKPKLFGLIALGAFILTVIDIVPFIGWLVSFAILMIAFGAFWTYKKQIYDDTNMQKF